MHSKNNKTFKRKNLEDEELNVPLWLRILLIIIAILALIGIATKGTGPFRTDFPIF